MKYQAILLAMAAIATFATAVYALNNRVAIDRAANQHCVLSNGRPDHGAGQVPHAGGPQSKSEQDIKVCGTFFPA